MDKNTLKPGTPRRRTIAWTVFAVLVMLCIVAWVSMFRMPHVENPSKGAFRLIPANPKWAVSMIGLDRRYREIRSAKAWSMAEKSVLADRIRMSGSFAELEKGIRQINESAGFDLVGSNIRYVLGAQVCVAAYDDESRRREHLLMTAATGSRIRTGYNMACLFASDSRMHVIEKFEDVSVHAVRNSSSTWYACMIESDLVICDDLDIIRRTISLGAGRRGVPFARTRRFEDAFSGGTDGSDMIFYRSASSGAIEVQPEIGMTVMIGKKSARVHVQLQEVEWLKSGFGTVFKTAAMSPPPVDSLPGDALGWIEIAYSPSEALDVFAKQYPLQARMLKNMRLDIGGVHLNGVGTLFGSRLGFGFFHDTSRSDGQGFLLRIPMERPDVFDQVRLFIPMLLGPRRRVEKNINGYSCLLLKNCSSLKGQTIAMAFASPDLLVAGSFDALEFLLPDSANGMKNTPAPSGWRGGANAFGYIPDIGPAFAEAYLRIKE